jgi:hypothetical protein
MAGRTRETFAKRQKERARQEKQRDKIAKRQERKSPQASVSMDDHIDWTARSEGAPEDDGPTEDE